MGCSPAPQGHSCHGQVPGRRARELCPHLIFVGGHFSEYQRLGDAAIDVLRSYTPSVERISIDEAFADVAGCERLFGHLAQRVVEVAGGDLRWSAVWACSEARFHQQELVLAPFNSRSGRSTLRGLDR